MTADGSFTIPNVTLTHYELSVYGSPSDYVGSAALGGKDILEMGMTFSPGGNAPARLCSPVPAVRSKAWS